MKDRLWDQPVFTVEEAAEICRVSQRTMYDWIKKGFIECIRHTSDVTKREKKLIARNELEGLGFLSPLKVEITKLNAKEFLEQRETEAHINEVYNLKKKLKSELWLPPLYYLPTRDLSARHDAYKGHTIYWTAEDGSSTIKLPVESGVNFVCFRKHTESSGFWQILREWKQIGGQYIHNRSILLNNIREDIQAETDLPTVLRDTERGILEGFSRVIFRHLFPQVRSGKKTAKGLAEDAISLASDGHWNKAAETNRNIARMYPGDVNALNRLGKALIELQRYASAKEAYSRALEIGPSDLIARKRLKELIQKHKDDSGIISVDGGRYRVVSRKSDLWLLAVFTDDEGENIASVFPNEIDMIITIFSNLLRKYRASSETETILELGMEINKLKQNLSEELEAITLDSIADAKCDVCPV